MASGWRWWDGKRLEVVVGWGERAGATGSQFKYPFVVPVSFYVSLFIKWRGKLVHCSYSIVGQKFLKRLKFWDGRSIML
jgi:hypothetical protein